MVDLNKKRRRVKVFSGTLAQPIDSYRVMLAGVLGGEVDPVGDVRLQKLQELFRHYGIDPARRDAWSSLALGLAFDFVPGLSVGGAVRKKGRPQVWTLEKKVELVTLVQALVHNHGLKEKPACRHLGRLARQCGVQLPSYSAETLYRNYTEFRKQPQIAAKVAAHFANHRK